MVADAPVNEPTVVACSIAFDPNSTAPVPAFNTKLVDPVSLPSVIVLAEAPVPILIEPVPSGDIFIIPLLLVLVNELTVNLLITNNN